MTLHLSKVQDEDDEEDDDECEDDSDDEDSHFRTTYLEDKGLPNNYKERKAHLSSLRVDAVLSAGLNISRRFTVTQTFNRLFLSLDT